MLTPLPAGTTIARLFPVGIPCVRARRARSQLRGAAMGKLLGLGYGLAALVESFRVGCGAFAVVAGGASGMLSSDWMCARSLMTALPWI